MAIAGTAPEQSLDKGKIMATFTLSLRWPRPLTFPDPGEARCACGLQPRALSQRSVALGGG